MTRDRGQALIESILLGLILLVPLVWLLAVLSDVHRTALATAAAAREGGARAARAMDATAAERELEGAIRSAMLNHGLIPGRSRVRWNVPRGFARGGSVGVEIAYPVPILRVPFVGDATGPTLWIRARHIARVDPFRSRTP